MKRLFLLIALAAVGSAQAQQRDCAPLVAAELKANAALRAALFDSSAHAHAKQNALAELKRSDELFERSCPARTQEDADRRIQAAVHRVNAKQIITRGTPQEGAL